MSTEHQETVPGPEIASRKRRKRFRGKRFALAAALTAAMAAVAACGGGSGGDGGGGGGGDATTINYWSPPQDGFSESGTKEALQPLVDRFKAESGITVNVEVVDWSSLLAKLTSAIASNTGPDVAGGGNTWNGIYTDTGGIVSWTPEMLEQIGGKDQFVPAFTKVMGYPDKDPVSIPIGGGTWQMVYNKKILADAGVTEIPKTWDEFLVAAQKTTDPSKGIWGTSSDVANVSNMTTWQWILIRQYGGDFFDASTGKASANLPQNVQAMKFFIDWINNHKIMSPKAAQYNASQAEEDFNNGKVAFLFTQGRSQVTMDQSEYGAAYLPMRSESPPPNEAVMSHIAGENVILFESSDKRDAAIKWVKFLLEDENHIEKNLLNGSIPVTKSAATSPKFSHIVDKIDIEIASKYAQTPQINSDDGPLTQSFARAIGQLAGQAATGKDVTEADIAEALKGVQEAALAREATQR